MRAIGTRCQSESYAWVYKGCGQTDRQMCIFLNRDSVLQTENLRPIRSSGSTEGALEEAGRAEQHIITDAAPNELKLVRVRKVMRAGYRQGGGIGGVFIRRCLRKPPRRFGVFGGHADTRAHTLFEYPLGSLQKLSFSRKIRLFIDVVVSLWIFKTTLGLVCLVSERLSRAPPGHFNRIRHA